MPKGERSSHILSTCTTGLGLDDLKLTTVIFTSAQQISFTGDGTVSQSFILMSKVFKLAQEIDQEVLLWLVDRRTRELKQEREGLLKMVSILSTPVRSAHFRLA